MDNDKALKEALEVFGRNYVAELSNQLRKQGSKASGELLQSLDSRVIQTAMGTIYTIELKASDYLKYVDKGRRPTAKGAKKGSPSLVEQITKWVRFKGISPKAVYPITKKIHKFGIKPTNVIEKTLNIMNRQKELNELENNLEDWVDEMITDLYFDLSKNINTNITVKKK